MSTTIEDISTTKKRLNIEIPTDVIEKEYRKSLDTVRQKAKIPGFRAGKAPDNIIEKKFGNDIKADILDRLVPDYYTRTLKGAGLVPVTLPNFESELDIKKNEPFLIKLTVEVRPDIGDLNYTGLKVGEVQTQVEEKEIEDTIKELRERRVSFEPVDREIREDDLIVIDYIKFDPSGEKEIASAKDQVMNLGRNLTPQGILDEILGKRKGDVADIILPQVEGQEIKDESGKGERLKITVKEVKEKKLPEIDSEFAKDFGHDTLESLHEHIRERLLLNKQDHAKNQQKAKLLDMLIESKDFDLPESLLKKEIERLTLNEDISDKQPKTPAGGTDDPEVKKDPDADENLKAKAVKNVKASMLLDIIGEKEKITVSEAELKTRIEGLARHMQATPDAIVNFFMTRDGSLENFRSSIRDEKVMDLIFSKAEIVKGA